MKRHNYRCSTVLFDMDGTILDTIPLIVESFQHTYLENLGRKDDAQTIIAGIGLPLTTVFGQYPADLAQSLMNSFIEHNSARLDSHVAIFLGMTRLFDDLQAAGIRMGVVTSKRIEAALSSIRFFQLEDYFQVIVGKEATDRRKPHPEPIFEAMRQLELTDPRDLIYVGDSIHDLECAQNAGSYAAIVDWTYMDRAPLRAGRPDLWMQDPQDLCDWLVKE